MIEMYIGTRHWDYWYGVYGFYDDPTGLEFDVVGNNGKSFFHFDLLNLNCLENHLKSGDYISRDGVNYTILVKKYEELKTKNIQYFIGILYFPRSA